MTVVLGDYNAKSKTGAKLISLPLKTLRWAL